MKESSLQGNKNRVGIAVKCIQKMTIGILIDIAVSCTTSQSSNSVNILQ